MKFFLCIIALMFSVASFAQSTPQEKLDTFSAHFVSSIRTHEKQRVYLATDKSVYINGESLWFKAFLVNDISGKINNDSKFLFVDVVDNKDNVIKTVILDAANKQTDSRIILPATLPSGNYWLRAYTREILKTDPNNICVKPIYVINRTDDSNFKTQLKKANPSDSLVVTLYPEGGNIITGVSSTVAVRAADLNGNPVAVKGLIRDNYETVMGGFTTDEYGLAKFDFEPSNHRNYRAVVNWNGKEISYPLPPSNFYGGQISVTKAAPNYMVQVLLGDSIYTKNALSYLIAISRGNMVFASIGRGLYQVAVPEKKLLNGIVTFYLFDDNFHFLSERSVYVEDNSLHVKLTTDKEIYAPHEKVTMDLSMADGDQQPVASLVAVSVIDSKFSDPSKECPVIPKDYSDETIDNIFLSGDECLTEKEKGLMMLIRKGNYETLSKSVEVEKYIDNDSLLYLKGVVLNEKGGPVADKIVTLISSSIFHSATTNNEGRFSFPLDNYTDSTQFALRVTNLKGRPDNSKIVLDTITYPKVTTPASLKESATLDSRKVRKYIDTYYPLNTDDKHVLPDVNLKDQKELGYDASKRVSASSTILTSKDLKENSSVGNAILRVGGLHMLNGYLVINGLTQMGAPDGGSEPMVLVNGAPAMTSVGGATAVGGPGDTSPDISYLNTFDPKSIDFIEILKGADGARYGTRGGNGVILVNTLNNIKVESSPGNNVQTYYATGISKPGLFLITTYPENEVKPATFVERHSTLFWDGNYFTEKADNTITFYNSDIPATYKVMATGITIYGDIINKTITFKSK
ncbi:MAG: TonB-dependent receptor plug domain-containing protein [Ferruginibacter sp.]